MSEFEKWWLYVQRMQIIRAAARTPEEYERMQKELLAEMGL